ncbi:MAG: SDR family NAD(P)-dependent oxidoreductase [Chloroflexi bacterium]|nr:SDR family NAD(P)-dependent oxidoreductase [Chloroflexota bacterium]
MMPKPRTEQPSLEGQVVLVTGSSRGLGYLLAREFGREGAKLVITARDSDALVRAAQDLKEMGFPVKAIPADVRKKEDVERLIDEATAFYGRVDILVNNAGIIQVGPENSMTLENFEQAMADDFWSGVYTTFKVLPQMRERGSGQIVNITSIGGKVSVPHLLPYSAAKFALTGFSEGMRTELKKDGISVTTIVPGLMRTGSHLNAYFKGEEEKEFGWFSLGASLPFISMDAEVAAAQIVEATRLKKAERILSVPANLLARFQGLFPGVTSEILTLVNDLGLPKSDQKQPGQGVRGAAVENEASNPVFDVLTTLGRQAANRFRQHPGPVDLENSR